MEGERTTRLGVSVQTLAAIGGAFLVVLAAIVDITVGAGISLLVVGPLVTATIGRARDTAIVATIAVVASIPLGFVGDSFTAKGHWIAVVAVAIGGVLAVAGARLRERERDQRLGVRQELGLERDERARADLLVRAGELLGSPFEPHDMLAALADLAVPDMADMCLIDVVADDGALSCEAIGADDKAWIAELRAMRARYPLDPEGVHPVAIAARTGFARLLPAMSSADLRSFASSDEHYEAMRRQHYGSAVVVPLVSGGRTLAVISLVRLAQSPVYVHGDLRAAADLAHRVALALDNRRLFTDLRRTERRLDATLSNLTEAVTVIDRTGLLYANQAAADTLGYANPEELLKVPFPEMYRRFTAYGEDGHLFPLDKMPVVRVLTGRPAPPIVLRIIDRENGNEFWRLSKASPVRDEDGNVVFAVSVVEDITEVKRAELSQRFLASASKLLGSSLDHDVVLEKAAWAVVPEVADWCVVHMPDEHGVMRQVAFAHRDPSRAALGEELAEHTPNERSTVLRAWRTGAPVLLSEVPAEGRLGGADNDRASDLMRELGLQSVAAVPMRSGDELIGVISFVTEPPRRLEKWQLELVEELGRRAGVAVENSRVHEARTYIATTLQNSLLPPRLPTVPGLEIAARFRAAGDLLTEVGGDFYDMFAAAEGWMIVMGDVTGKGPEAAATTSLARYTLRTAATYEAEPALVLARLNAALAVDEDRRQLCTAICAQVVPDPEGGRARVRLACAGHPPPFLLRGDEPPRLAGRPGALLGAFDDADYTDDVIELEAGDVLVLYTDGVTDTRGETERFGQERLADALTGVNGLDAEQVAARLDDAVLAFQDGPQRDDVAVLVVRCVCPAEARDANAGARAAAA